MKSLFCLLFIFLFTACELPESNSASAQSSMDVDDYTLETLCTTSDVIWGFDFISSDEIIFTERGGKLSICDVKTKTVKPVEGAPAVFAKGQGGLLDILIHPKTKKIYITFSEKTDLGATTSLFRADLSTDKTKLQNGQVIFKSTADDDTDMHFGSRVVADDSDHLFMSIGERNKRDKAQDPKLHHGKIMRLTLDGNAEIWSRGHRNTQGLAFDASGKLYNAEMGPRGGDEVNIITKGLNYGWPIITYGNEYYGPPIGTTHKEGLEQPFLKWVPSISPSGLAFYTGSRLEKFKDNLFLATLSGQHVHRVVFNKDMTVAKEEQLFVDLKERFRQVKQGPDGTLYFSTDSGKLYKLY
ncbi:MAG: PQQ-dependent sugar dehydrogenase [Bdellovibrionota bacterium]